MPNKFTKLPPLVKPIFKKYVKQVYPDGIPPEQFVEIKNAFMAGFFASLYETSELAKHTDENFAVNVLEALYKECMEHAGEAIRRFYTIK